MNIIKMLKFVQKSKLNHKFVKIIQKITYPKLK